MVGNKRTEVMVENRRTVGNGDEVERVRRWFKHVGQFSKNLGRFIISIYITDYL